MSEIKVDRAKAQRAGHRGYATKLVHEANSLLEDGGEEDIQRARDLAKTLGKRIETITKLDEIIIDLVDVENVEHEVFETSELEERLNDVLHRLNRFICGPATQKKEETQVNHIVESVKETTASTSYSQSPSTVPKVSHATIATPPPKIRLPKITLPHFKGELTKFAPFWDVFESNIHNNPSLSTVDKFSYFKSCLEGEAARAIEGIPVTDANYNIVIDIIKQRYGNKQQLISAHMDELLKLPSCNERLNQLKYVYDKINVHVRGLKALGVDSDQYGSLLIPIVMARIPREISVRVARVVSEEVWNIEDVLTVLRKEVEARELSDSVRVKVENHQQKKSLQPQPSASALFVKDKHQTHVTPACAFCCKEHYSAECESVRDPEERKKILRRENRCFSCLKVGHRASNCHRSRKCRVCSGQHHQAICKHTAITRNVVDNTKNDDNTIQTNITTNVANSKLCVVLQTARAEISLENKTKRVNARVLFDSGSQRSYVTESLRKKLKAPTIKTEMLNLNTFGSKGFTKQKCDIVELFIGKNGKERIKVKALTFPNICSNIPARVDVQRYSHLRGLELADDVESDTNDGVDILIGCDYYWQFITGNIVKGKNGPVGVESNLGWIVSGILDETKEQNDTRSAHTNLLVNTEITGEANTADELTESLKAFWNVENIAEPDIENDISQTFQENISFDGERYTIRLPLRSDTRDISDHYTMSLNRLRSLGKRLRGDKELAKAYDDVIKEQLNSGIIERVPTSRNDNNVHYLPHHGVLKEDRSTTKLRIVFDGSARDGEYDMSINDLLDKGPNLTPNVFSILMRFRSYPVPLTADIEKAFHQISIHESDRDLLRFLWFQDVMNESSPVVEYRFRRLVFGLTSSPAVLNTTVQHHLSLYSTKKPLAAERLANSLYVDDFIAGANDVDSAYELYLQSKEIMKDGGFNLRKWQSSSAELRDKIQPEESSTETKILGLCWNIEEDFFRFDFSGLISYLTTLPATKRSLLRVSAKLFDPLGLISPFVIKLKLCFQDICKQQSKVEWDEPLEGELLELWHKFVNEINTLSEIQVPRCYTLPGKTKVKQELHGFSDASERAYAAVVYLVTYYDNTEIDVKLVASKTRVAPIKKQSIPRLELQGAYLLSELISAVKESGVTADEEYYWTDSFTVLCWIRNNKPWRQYVQHRVDKIRELTCKEKWRYCPGSQNPADIPSRSCPGRDLANKTLWWNGPEFLTQGQREWPDMPTRHDNDRSSDEIRKNTPQITHSLTTQTHHNEITIDEVIDINRFSSRTKLLRVTALVFKFIKLTKSNATVKREISAEDLREADKAWTRRIQKSFIEECKETDRGQTYKYRQLNLFMDEDGLLRCRGRLEQSNLSEQTKHPIVLPPRHRFTTLLIEERHRIVHHNGIKETLNALRETHWVVKGRQAVKSLVSKCCICRRYDGQPYHGPQMPDLPHLRVSDCPPFTYTGIDFAGPLHVRGSEANETSKSYCCLFTCASTRAVHLELTEELSVNSFLQAFRRFSSRRGLPDQLISDNAKTFRAATKDVKRIVRSEEVQQYLTNKQVTWNFIVEKAPWWGGFWERLVRSVKRCLKKSIGRTSLTFEELRTILVEIEATINNRPLTYMYDDTSGVTQPLTPSNLIYGRQISRTPTHRQTDIVSTYQALTKRAKYHYRLLETFVKQWKKEYLTDLHAVSYKSNSSSTPISTGDIVLIKEDTPARAWWKVSRVKELIKGRDNKVRAAIVTVLGGKTTQRTIELRRPVQQLVPLEVREH